MAQAQGTKGRLIIQKESVYGVDPAADAQKLYFESETLTKSLELIESNLIHGDRNATAPVRGNTDVGGSIITELGAYPGLLFEGLLGSVATTGAGPYVHVIKVADTLPSYMIEKGFTDIGKYFKYNGCKFNKLSMDINASGFMNITLDVMGAKETPADVTFDATATDLGKASFDGFSVSSIEEGGVPIANVRNIKGFTIDNSLDGDTYLVGGQGNRGSINDGIVKITGTLSCLFDSMTLYNKAINSTESSLKIKFTKGDGLGSAGNESLEIFVPELIYSVKTPAIAGPKGVLVELPFRAYYNNAAAASSIQVTLKNTQAAL
jgi:hypothetical protein